MLQVFLRQRNRGERKETNLKIKIRLEKENKAIKDGIIKDIETLFEQEEEDYYKPVRFGNFWNNNYIKYESSGDRNKTLSIK